MFYSPTNFFILMSFIFIMMVNHPMVILFLVLMISLLISLNSLYLMSNSWISLILILLYSGGMLVLFLFVVSMTPNFQMKKIIPILLLMVGLSVPLFFGSASENTYFEKKISNLMTVNWFYMNLITALLIMVTYMISNLIFSPLSPMKTN